MVESKSRSVEDDFDVLLFHLEDEFVGLQPGAVPIERNDCQLLQLQDLVRNVGYLVLAQVDFLHFAEFADL
jgi:hypothetical protein